MITATNGLTVAVEDVDPGGVKVTALCPGDDPGDTPSCSDGPIEMEPCGLAMTLSLDPGDSVTLTCGSVTITAETGDVTATAGEATITIPNGVTATLDTNGDGATVISGVSGGAVTVEVNNVTATVGPGQSRTFATQYDFVGFTQPVDMAGFNIAKAGNGIPLKWRVLDAQGSPVSDIASATASVKPSNRCSGGTAGDVIETYVAGNQSALQNLGNGYYQLDWRTTKSWSNSCKELVFSLDGATVLEANPAFSFK